jgi:hypothetical protein
MTSKGKSKHDAPQEGDQAWTWSRAELLRMDAAFVQAMQAAIDVRIEEDEEHRGRT